MRDSILDRVEKQTGVRPIDYKVIDGEYVYKFRPQDKPKNTTLADDNFQRRAIALEKIGETANTRTKTGNKLIDAIHNSSFIQGADRGYSSLEAGVNKLLGKVFDLKDEQQWWLKQKYMADANAKSGGWATAGEMFDPTILTPAGIFTKAKKAEMLAQPLYKAGTNIPLSKMARYANTLKSQSGRIGQNALAGGAIGAGLMGAKAYGDDTLTTRQKLIDTASGAVFGAGLNTLATPLIRATPNARFNAIPQMQNTSNNQVANNSIIDAISGNPDAYGLSGWTQQQPKSTPQQIDPKLIDEQILRPQHIYSKYQQQPSYGGMLPPPRQSNIATRHTTTPMSPSREQAGYYPPITRGATTPQRYREPFIDTEVMPPQQQLSGNRNSVQQRTMTTNADVARATVQPYLQGERRLGLPNKFDEVRYPEEYHGDDIAVDDYGMPYNMMEPSSPRNYHYTMDKDGNPIREYNDPMIEWEYEVYPSLKNNKAKNSRVLSDRERFARLKKHPLYERHLKDRENVSSRDIRYGRKAIEHDSVWKVKLSNYKNQFGEFDEIGATDGFLKRDTETNHTADFLLTKAGVDRLKRGKPTNDDLERLSYDFDMYRADGEWGVNRDVGISSVAKANELESARLAIAEEARFRKLKEDKKIPKGITYKNYLDVKEMHGDITPTRTINPKYINRALEIKQNPQEFAELEKELIRLKSTGGIEREATVWDYKDLKAEAEEAFGKTVTDDVKKDSSSIVENIPQRDVNINPPPQQPINTTERFVTSNEKLTTATGRETTPYPKINVSNNQKAGNSLKKGNQWLIDNAILEAKARNDDFNLMIFEGYDAKNLSPADIDSLNLYLFDDELATSTKTLNQPNILFARGGDNVLAGTVAGIDVDEDGNVSFDAEKFVMGLGGYTAVKALLKNKQFQGAMRDYAQRALYEIETGISQNSRFAKAMMGNNYMVDPSKGMQKEMRGIYNVTFNGKNATEVRKADGSLVEYAKGNLKYGADHIRVRHLGDNTDGELTTKELLNLGEIIRNGELTKDGSKHIYTYFKEDGTRFRAIVGSNDKGETVISFYSNRRGGSHNAQPTPPPASDEIIPQNQKDVNINLAPSLGGGAFGGSDALINQRDYDGDGEFTYKDLLIGAGLGAGGAKALQKAKPDWFKNDFKDADAVAGMFTGAKPTDKGAFSDIVTKKMMREIDDRGSRLLINDSRASSLSNVLEHPKLYKEHPELKDIDTNIHIDKDIPKGSPNGSYTPRQDRGDDYFPIFEEINIRAHDLEDAKSVLLHEIQHAIQGKEGWARGGNTQSLIPQQLAETLKLKYGELPAFDKIENDFLDSKIATEDEMYSKMINLAKDNYGGLDKLKYDTYQRLWGEQQARATQHRANYTPEQRASESWTDTLAKQEGAYNEPIIKYDDGVAMHISSNKPLDEKIAYLQNETRESFKKIKNPTVEQKAMYDLIMGLKKVVGIQRQDSFDIAQVLVKKGYQRYEQGSGLDHIIFRHFGKGAEGELSAREILNIGKTIQDGTLTREVPRDLKDSSQIYEKVRVYKRNVNPKDDVNLYVVVGEDRNKIQNVITYYSNREHIGDNLSKSTTEIPIKGDISSTTPNGTATNGKIVSQPTENVNPNMRGGFVNNPFHETPEGARGRIQHAVNMVQKELSKEWGEQGGFRELFVNTLSSGYMKNRQATVALNAQIGHKLERLHHALAELPADTNKALHKYLVGELDAPPVGLEALAKNIRNEVDTLGKTLVDEGVLSQQAYDEWAGHYLKRSYDKHFFKDATGAFKRGWKIDEIHERGKIETVTQGKLDEMFKSGEITDAKLNMPLKDGGYRIEELVNGKFKVKRDWTPLERERMGEITDASISVSETLMRLHQMVNHAKMLKQIEGVNGAVLPKDEVLKYTAEELKKMGYSTLPNSPRYGVLAGKTVRKDVANDIKGIHDNLYNEFFGSDNTFARAWLGYQRLWKKSKTVWHAPAHFNNFTSNMVLMHLSGMKGTDIVGGLRSSTRDIIDGKKFEHLYRKELNNTITPAERIQLAELKPRLKYFQEAKEMGLFERSQLQDVLRGQKMAPTNTDAGFFKKGLIKADEVASYLYQAEDYVHRLTMYKTLRDKYKMSKEEARSAVESIMPDYTKPMPKGWRFLRDTGISPFISWTYYVMPTVAKLVASKQGAKQVAKLMGAVYGISWLTSGINPIENMPIPFRDEAVPDSYKGARIPIAKNGDEITTIKLDRIIPYMEAGMSPINFIRNTFAGVTTGATYTAWTGSGDGSAKQLYMDAPITKASKPVGQRVIDWGKYISQNYVPLPQQFYSGIDVLDSIARSKDNRSRGNETVPRTTPQNLLKLIGINTLTYDKHKLEQKQAKARRKAENRPYF